jgi:Ca2+-binding RTX toxin-like protein
VGATSWHINADEPEWTDYNLEDKAAGNDWYQPTAFRASDHDPMLIGLNVVKKLGGTAGNDTIVGTDGDDVIEGGLGRDTLTGKGGANQFVYRTGSDGLDTITDFKPGVDSLVFTDLLKSVGINSGAPLATGHVTCVNQADGALIGYDPDGSAGAAASRPVAKLKAVLCAAINSASFKF